MRKSIGHRRTKGNPVFNPPGGFLKPAGWLLAAATAAVPTFAWATSNSWDGGSASNGNWSNGVNWVGDTNVPGAGDTATFNTAIANTWGLTGTPVVIDSTTQNIGSITFDTAAGNFFIGSAAGNSLFLNSGGTIQIASTTTSATAVETINAPLVINGANATYTFANNKNSTTSALVLGAISGGTAGNTVITFSGIAGPTSNAVNGIISNGSSTTLSIAQTSGKWTLTGTNTYTGSTTINAGLTTVSGVNGTIKTSSGYAIQSGGTLALDYTGAASNATVDRLNNSVSSALSLSNSTLTLTANATASTNTSETMGILRFGAGQSTVTLNSATGNVITLNAKSLDRVNQGTALVRGSNLNGSTATNTSRIFFTDAPSGANFVGSGGSAAPGSTKNLGIVPWLVGNTAVGSAGNNFLTYDATGGLRVLATAESQTTISAAVAPGVGQTGDNVKMAADESGVATKTINSLFLTAASTITGVGGNSLTVSSGAIGTSSGAGVVAGFSNLNFGNGEAVVATTSASGSLTLDSVVGISGASALTKTGTGTLILTKNNTFSGPTTVNQGTIQIGNGGTTGDLGTSSDITLLPPTGSTYATIDYNRSNALTINSVTGTGKVNSNNATGTLTLNQVGAGKTIYAVSGISGATFIFGGDGTGVTTVGDAAAALNSMQIAGETFKFNAGTVNFIDNGRGIASDVEINGATVNNSNTYSFTGVAGGTQRFTLTSGQLNVLNAFGLKGFNGNGGASSTTGILNSTFIGNQSGGIISIATGGSNATFDLGNNLASSNDSTTYNLSNGLISVISGTNTGGMRIGADVGGSSKATFNMSGGKLLVGGSISGAQSTGAKQSFVWTGGTLATLSYIATNLTSTDGTPVSGSTNTLTNAGGTLSPGDGGTAGRFAVTGNYNVTSSNAALAIDIGGTTASVNFQDAANSGTFDRFVITGTGTLAGKLNVGLIDNFTPTNANTFAIVTTVAAGRSGTFTNTAPASTAAGGGVRVALANGLSSLKVTYNTADVTLGGYLADNEWTGATGTNWTTANDWTSFIPSQAGHIAKFASSPAAGAVAVNLDANETIRTLQFNSTTRNYTIVSGNSSGLTFDSGGTAVDVPVVGTHNVNVPISLTSNLSVTPTNSGDSLGIGGIISGVTRSLTKAGAGTLTLSGQNTYSGGTTVSSGKLLLTNSGGSGTGSGAVNVSIGATLGGNGFIVTAANAGVTFASGSKLAPGTSPGTLTMDLGSGSLDISGQVNANNTQSLLFDLDTPSTSDSVQLTNALSALNIGTGVLEFNDFAFTPTINLVPGTYVLFDTGKAINGTLGANLSGSLNAQLNGTLSLANSSNDVILTVSLIPEPATFGMLTIGALSLLGGRRPRRTKR